MTSFDPLQTFRDQASFILFSNFLFHETALSLHSGIFVTAVVDLGPTQLAVASPAQPTSDLIYSPLTSPSTRQRVMVLRGANSVCACSEVIGTKRKTWSSPIMDENSKLTMNRTDAIYMRISAFDKRVRNPDAKFGKTMVRLCSCFLAAIGDCLQTLRRFILFGRSTSSWRPRSPFRCPDAWAGATYTTLAPLAHT